MNSTCQKQNTIVKWARRLHASIARFYSVCTVRGYFTVHVRLKLIHKSLHNLLHLDLTRYSFFFTLLTLRNTLLRAWGGVLYCNSV